jgi:16S rRNA (uracil1498-N3)-methyltransferase
MHVFFQTDLSNPHVFLNEEESKHCVRVLRLKKGDEVHLTDGKGIHAIALIGDDHPKKCILDIVSTTQTQRNRKYYLHIVVAPTKNMERIEWFLEKATEIGIDEVSFIETTNSERTRVNMERFEKITVSAMKQSKQWYLPKLNDIQKLSTLLPTLTGDLKFIAWCETPHTDLLSKQLQQKHLLQLPSITIFIGPEGDFTKAETELVQHNGFIPSSLGQSILRTETAALYACMAVQTIFN